MIKNNITENEMREIIKELIKQYPDTYIHKLKAKCYENKYGGFIEYINNYTKVLSDPKYRLPTKIYWFLNEIKDFPKCKFCGKPITRNVASVIVGYTGGGKYCSNSCSMSSDEHKKRMEKIALEKYGSTSIIGSPSVRKKIMKTQREHIKNDSDYWNKRNAKTKKTVQEKYGCDCVLQMDSVRYDLKKYNLKKYGCQYPLQSEDIKDKIKQHNIKKYGCEYPAQNKEYQERLTKLAATEESKEKRRKTLLKRYGVQNSFSLFSKEAIEQIRRKSYERLQRTTVVPNFTIDELLSLTGNRNTFDKPLSWKCMECGQIFEQIPFQHCYNGSWARCLNCHPFINTGYSIKEKQLLEYVKTNYPNLNILENNRETILNPDTGYGLELDIYIPEIKFAIEFNGEYWHTKEKSKNHDKIKREQCEKLNLKLIQIDEIMWDNKQSDIKNLINKEINDAITRNSIESI